MHVSYFFCLISLCSIHAKLRDTAPGYDITLSFFLRCLYKGEDGDLENPLDSFLKGLLLFWVSFQVYNDIKQMLMLLLQAFWHIFTSPSSATKGKVTSRQYDITNVLQMNNHVTSRLIAYTASQVRFQFLMIFRSFLMFLLSPSSSFHLAQHENGSMNTMAFTIHCSMISSLTSLRNSRMIQHRRVLMNFSIGRISTSH